MAATTITRTTWTDDSGAGLDGTIITNAKLQEIYAAIDAEIAANITFGGTIGAEGAGTHTISAGTSGNQILLLRNTADGTGASAYLSLGNNASASAGLLRVHAQSYTGSALYPQDGLTLEGSRAGGVVIAATNASGTISFITGGSAARGTITSAGLFTWSTYGQHSFSSSGAASQTLVLNNSTSGTGAHTTLYVTAGTTNAVLQSFSQGYTITATTDIQASTRLYCDGVAGFALDTPNGPIRFYTAGSRRMIINSAVDPWIQLASAATAGSMPGTNLMLESIFSNADTGNFVIYGLHQVQTAAATVSVGLDAYATHTYTTGTTGTGIAGFFGYEQAGTGGTTTAASAVSGSMFASAGTITTGIAFSASFPTTSGTITTGIGFKAGTFGSGVTTKFAFYCDDLTARSYFGGGFLLGERTTAPANPADGTEWQVYAKADLFVIAYNHGGTMKYRYLTGTSTDATWTYSTSAP